jgi:hypothetical protein
LNDNQAAAPTRPPARQEDPKQVIDIDGSDDDEFGCDARPEDSVHPAACRELRRRAFTSRGVSRPLHSCRRLPDQSSALFRCGTSKEETDHRFRRGPSFEESLHYRNINNAIRERRVVVNETEAETTTYILRCYGELACVGLLPT